MRDFHFGRPDDTLILPAPCVGGTFSWSTCVAPETGAAAPPLRPNVLEAGLIPRISRTPLPAPALSSPRAAPNDCAGSTRLRLPRPPSRALRPACKTPRQTANAIETPESASSPRAEIPAGSYERRWSDCRTAGSRTAPRSTQTHARALRETPAASRADRRGGGRPLAILRRQNTWSVTSSSPRIATASYQSTCPSAPQAYVWGTHTARPSRPWARFQPRTYTRTVDAAIGVSGRSCRSRS